MVMSLWLVVLLSALVAHIIRVWSRLRHVPGPARATISKLWQVVTQIKGDWYLELKSLGDKHGKIVTEVCEIPKC